MLPISLCCFLSKCQLLVFDMFEQFLLLARINSSTSTTMTGASLVLSDTSNNRIRQPCPVEFSMTTWLCPAHTLRTKPECVTVLRRPPTQTTKETIGMRETDKVAAHGTSFVKRPLSTDYETSRCRTMPHAGERRADERPSTCGSSIVVYDHLGKSHVAIKVTFRN